MRTLPHYIGGDDTIALIAEMYGSQPEWILQANPGIHLDSDLKEIAELKVPIVHVQFN